MRRSRRGRVAALAMTSRPIRGRGQGGRRETPPRPSTPRRHPPTPERPASREAACVRAEATAGRHPPETRWWMTPTSRLRACGAPEGGSRGGGYRPVGASETDGQRRASGLRATFGVELDAPGDRCEPALAILGGVCAQCMASATTAAAGAAGIRAWLGARTYGWITPERLRFMTVVVIVLAFVAAAVGFG
jgi:hypothetical protein